MNQSSLKSLRLHIGIFGRRNVGKSSLLNALVGQGASIVSPVAGTTTDPVEKPMELQPLGPVLFIDTAGLDDSGALGELRTAKTRQVFDRTDLAILVCDSNQPGDWEARIERELEARRTPIVRVRSKCDQSTAREPVPAGYLCASSATGEGLEELRAALLRSAPAGFTQESPLVSDLVRPGDVAVLVTPIDKEAPRGRLILPQVQAIRDLLDGDAICMVVKERELKAALESLSRRPGLVVTDSQAFLKVAGDVPDDVPMTSFSILMSRWKGDLAEQVRGAQAIQTLEAGDRVLIAEACTHHPIGEDIGQVKIPRWLRQYVGGALEFVQARGHDFPSDLASYKLVIHCGGCMFNRREMLLRIERCRRAGVSVTNYGLAIAYSLGIFKRALRPFGAVFEDVAEGATC